MNRLRTLTAVGLSAATFAGGGCGETPVDAKQQAMNQAAQKAANSAMEQLVAFAGSERVGNGVNNDAVVDEYDQGLGGKIRLSKFLDEPSSLDCEDETRILTAEVGYDNEDPDLVSELTVESTTYRPGCNQENSNITTREFSRGADGGWMVKVSRENFIIGSDLHDTSHKQAKTVGAVRKIAADAQADVKLLLADEPR